MNQHEYIKKFNELEFAVFCIKNVAKNWGGVNAASVYQAFTEKSDILNGYNVPEYGVLHTQSREYIVDDLLEVMKERGIAVSSCGFQMNIEKSYDMTANPILLQKNIVVS